MTSPEPVRVSTSLSVSAMAFTVRVPVVALPKARLMVATSPVVTLIAPSAAVLTRSPLRPVMVKLPLPAMVSVLPSGSAEASIVIETPSFSVIEEVLLPRTIVLMSAA